MPVDIFTNLGSTTLSSGGNTTPAAGTVETWTVASSGSFPTAVTGTSIFHIVEDDNTRQSEVIKVTNVSGTSWTVTRGAQGTTPVAHPNGSALVQMIDADFLNGLFGINDPPSAANVTAGTFPSGTYSFAGTNTKFGASGAITAISGATFYNDNVTWDGTNWRAIVTGAGSYLAVGAGALSLYQSPSVAAGAIATPALTFSITAAGVVAATGEVSGPSFRATSHDGFTFAAADTWNSATVISGTASGSAPQYGMGDFTWDDGSGVAGNNVGISGYFGLSFVTNGTQRLRIDRGGTLKAIGVSMTFTSGFGTAYAMTSGNNGFIASSGTSLFIGGGSSGTAWRNNANSANIATLSDIGEFTTSLAVLSSTSGALQLTGTGSGTYNKSVIYNDTTNDFLIDVARQTDAIGGTPRSFKIGARGGSPTLTLNPATGDVTGAGRYTIEGYTANRGSHQVVSASDGWGLFIGSGNTAASATPLLVRGAASQANPLTEWQSSTTATLSTINKVGQYVGGTGHLYVGAYDATNFSLGPNVVGTGVTNGSLYLTANGTGAISIFSPVRLTATHGYFYPEVTGQVVMTLRGLSGQTADLLQGNVNGGGAVFSISKDGLGTFAGGLTISAGAVSFPASSIAPAALNGLTAASVASGTFPGTYTITGSLTGGRFRLTATDVLTLASTTTHAFQIGQANSTNIAFDTTQIQARNNGAAATLFLNPLGGTVSSSGTAALNTSASGTSPATGVYLGNLGTVTSGTAATYWAHNVYSDGTNFRAITTGGGTVMTTQGLGIFAVQAASSVAAGAITTLTQILNVNTGVGQISTDQLDLYLSGKSLILGDDAGPPTPTSTQVAIYSSGGRGKIKDAAGNVWSLDSSRLTRVTADQATTTVANPPTVVVTDLTHTGIQPGTYSIEVNGFYKGSVTTIGLTLALNFTGTATSLIAGTLVTTSGTATTNGWSTGNNTRCAAAAASLTTMMPFQVTASMVVTVAGDLQVRFGPNSAGTITMGVGSYCRLTRVA